jgi:hypothetical protein
MTVFLSQSSKWSIHSQIIFATIERPSSVSYGNDISNIEEEFGGESRAINPLEKKSRGNDGVDWRTRPGEPSREHRPHESEKGTVTPSKASQPRKGRSRAFEPVLIGRSAFCGEQILHSIVIVAPLENSNSSQVLKK